METELSTSEIIALFSRERDRPKRSSNVEFNSTKRSPNPKRLKTLVSNVIHAKRNNLLHKFVLDNSYPNKSISEKRINGLLRTMSSVAVNALNEDGYSALHLAVLKNNFVMVEKLLFCLKNIDINKRCGVSTRNTALHFAVTLGYLPIIEKLLDKGANPNKQNWNDETALHLALELGDLNILQLLVRKGADVNIEDSISAFPLHHVARSGNLEAVKILVINGADVNVEAITGCTPIFVAVKSRNVPIVEYLINNGANVNAQNILDKSPLHYAVQSKSLEMTQLLVRNGADVNASDSHNETVLQYAEYAGSSEIVELLASKGAKLEATKKDKNRKKRFGSKTCLYIQRFGLII